MQYRIDVLKELSQADIDSDPSRWEGYFAGDMTNAFSSKEEALKIADAVANLRFPDWLIETKDEILPLHLYKDRCS